VQEAVKEYKNEMDLLTGFIEDAIVIDYTCNDRIMAKDLFAMYIKWAKQNNEYEMTSKKFFKEIAQKLPEKGRVSAGIYFSKIRFTDYAQNNLKERQYSFEDFKQ
jgi:putative DNA primase/helicase